jgi:anaerobic magnesium-protoporphyrin IX monomethyl ester cyclase
LTDVALVYPYIDPPRNRSIFRFPPLGLGYIAAHLRDNDYRVEIVDATFTGEEAVIEKVRVIKPRVIGVYSMFTMREASLRFARALRNDCELLVAGGPLPTVEPETYLDDFDAAAVGEGEQTMLEIARGDGLGQVNGLVFREDGGKLLRAGERGGKVVHTLPRKVLKNLDEIPLPARDLFDNANYIKYYDKRGDPPTTSAITSRGCPFACDFCSHPIFGESFRERSPENMADEVEQILGLGYRRVFFQDDCFTLTQGRVAKFCDEVERRGLRFGWECLSRVDSMDSATASRMRAAGCDQVFFGLESGNDKVLKIMNKSATPEMGRRAVEAAREGGLKTGAFFIFGYPGDDTDSMLETLHFADSLPLDYLSFTYPYPIPGTPLYERVKDKMMEGHPEPKQKGIVQHQLIYYSEIPEAKLRFGIIKGLAIHHLRHLLGPAAPLVVKPLEALTDSVFRLL